MTDWEQFRLDRVARMEEVSDRLFAVIDKALADGLEGEEFADEVRPAIEAVFVEEYRGVGEFDLFDTPAAAFRWAWDRIRPGLDAAGVTASARRIADWLGTAVVNAARVASGDEQRGKMWLSRRDDKVRPMHVDADGQVVAYNAKFTVGGYELDFPGQPVGPPQVWINCRCVVAREAVGEFGVAMSESSGHLTAAADPDATGKVIVAIPADDDPIWGASSEPKPHMTMIWLGKQTFADEDWQAILAAVRSAAEQFGEYEGPQEVPVTSRSTLGDDAADVLMVDPGKLTNLRDYMLTHETIRAAYEAVDQYPQWTPHVTLGYPDSPATGEPGETIRFDRLAVWDGEYQGEEFPMSVAVEEVPVADDDTIDVEGVDDPIADEEIEVEAAVPWYGVLAPEGEWSGDKRRFAEGALEWRDLPIPLLWQEKSGMGHEGSVVVGQIADIWKDGGLVWGAGTFAPTEDADKVVGLIAEEYLRGVSVDVDSAEMALEDDEQSITFSKGRISAATVVPIPAFHQAFIRLGTMERPEESVAASGGPGTVGAEDVPLPFRVYDTEARRRMAKEGHAMPDGSFPIADEEDLRNAIQAIGRAKDPDAAKAHIKKRARALGKGDLIPEEWAVGTAFSDAPGLLKDGTPPQCEFCANRATGFIVWAEGMAYVPYCDDHYDVPKFAPDISESDIDRRGEYGALAASAEAFDRGPGWITNPADTKRIHDYWTKPGNEGYAKVKWGTPGDFRRLRAYLSKYIGPRFLNRTTAQWHHDALGYWPGEAGKPGNPPVGARRHEGETIAAAAILASASDLPLNAAWFRDPGLTGPTPITVTEDGRIFGHLATWGTCHIGIPGACVTAPPSPSKYAYYRTGTVMTDEGAIPVGQITMDTGHASLSAGARAAASHYDNTGTAVADVAAGDDEFGIWVAGALRDSLPAQKVAAMRAGALSGDWREIGGNLELVAALVVNVPGFPVPHTGLAASGGHQSALVAAGVLIPTVGTEPDVEAAVEDLVSEVERRVAARADRRARAAALLEDTKALRVAALLTKVEV